MTTAKRIEDDDAGERRLIARIAAQDRAAFEDFYRAYAHRVLAFVRDVIVCTELAEEVASDAMIAVWTSAARFRGQSRVLTWVLGIAHHKAIDAVRRIGVAPVGLDTLAHFVSNELAPIDELLRKEDRFALDLALQALSAEHRTVLVLMYAFGCSQAEIAAVVGSPLATVKTRVFYAKRRLRAELDRAAAAEEIA